MKSSPAFTIIELLITFAILGVILIPAYSNYIRSRANQDLQGSAEELANILRLAHVFSRELRDEVEWGVRKSTLSETSYEFVKNQAVPVVDKTYALQRDVSFSPEFSQIWFKENDGFTGVETVIILQNKYGNRFQITVLVSGAVEVKALQ